MDTGRPEVDSCWPNRRVAVKQLPLRLLLLVRTPCHLGPTHSVDPKHPTSHHRGNSGDLFGRTVFLVSQSFRATYTVTLLFLFFSFF